MLKSPSAAAMSYFIAARAKLGDLERVEATVKLMKDVGELTRPAFLAVARAYILANNHSEANKYLDIMKSKGYQLDSSFMKHLFAAVMQIRDFEKARQYFDFCKRENLLTLSMLRVCITMQQC
jgi:hypothetical protein